MNRKVVMPTIALLALFMMVMSPVKAVRREPLSYHAELALITPGKTWVSDEGIVHTKGGYWNGTNVGTLGTLKEETWTGISNLDPATGKGTFGGGTWLFTLTPQDTLAGSYRGKTTEGYKFSGTAVGTHGTGVFEGAKVMGSFEGVFIDETHYMYDVVGIIMYP